MVPAWRLWVSRKRFCRSIQLLLPAHHPQQASRVSHATTDHNAGMEVCFIVCVADHMVRTYLEPFGHVCGTDLVVLVGHVTALQLAGLVDLEDATATHSPLGLLFRSIPGFVVLLFLFFLGAIERLRVKLGKVEVATKDLLGLL